MVASKPTNPSQQDGQGKDNSQADDNSDETTDLHLNECRLFLCASHGTGDASHAGILASQDNNTGSAAVGDYCAHQSNVTTLKEVLVSGVDRAFDLVRLSSKHRSVEANITRGRKQTKIGRNFVPDTDLDNVTNNKVG